jgi:hypothetical protein
VALLLQSLDQHHLDVARDASFVVAVARPPQHALLAPPAYYGAPNGPSFAPLPATPPHQQQAVPLSWSPWTGMWDLQSLTPPTTPPRMSVI